MNNNEIRSLYGLKYHKFVPDVPVEARSTPMLQKSEGFIAKTPRAQP